MTNAAEANSVENWDRIWSDPKETVWRNRVLEEVYDRIVTLVPSGASVVDLGGGVGTLAYRLMSEANCRAVVWDHSPAAVVIAPEGSRVVDLDIESGEDTPCPECHQIIVSTECMEHLPEDTVREWLRIAGMGAGGLISIPNNRLGPDEESQHVFKWTAKKFLDEMRHYGCPARVEVIGGFLLGVCGDIAKKSFRLSVCFPARDEEHDIERTLASFRGVADELVVGIDFRSKDRTREIAEQYADKVFTIEDVTGAISNVKVNFAHIRNRCIARCTGDWIFMTEAHERLLTGQDELLRLDQIPKHVSVGMVKRTGQGQQWGFPWLFKNDPKIKFERATHNVLGFPEDYFVIKLPGISTYHERHESNKKARAEQRKVQNRLALTEDWVKNGNESSLMYLGSEWATYSPEKAIERLREFLAVNRNNGAQRYHARIQCGKLLAMEGKLDEAREVMMGCVADDWSRVDHWFYLGDIATMKGNAEEGIQFYLYAATRIGNPPFTQWWLDLAIYGYLTAQRLVECYASIGNLKEALHWAEIVVDLMEDSPAEALKEARQNLEKIKEAMGHEN